MERSLFCVFVNIYRHFTLTLMALMMLMLIFLLPLLLLLQQSFLLLLAASTHNDSVYWIKLLLLVATTTASTVLLLLLLCYCSQWPLAILKMKRLSWLCWGFDCVNDYTLMKNRKRVTN